MPGIAEVYRRSLDRPQEFWAKAAERIDWVKPWDCVLDASRPPFYRWFAGGQLNMCWNALDRHVEAGRGARVALIYDSPVSRITPTGSRSERTAASSSMRNESGAANQPGAKSARKTAAMIPTNAARAIAMNEVTTVP